MSSAQEVLKSAVMRARLITPARWLRYWIEILTEPRFRRQEVTVWREYRQWRREYSKVLQSRLNHQHSVPRRVLVVGKGTVDGAKIELGLIKGLERAGFVSSVLTERRFVKYYKLAGVNDFLFWEHFTDPQDLRAAEAVIKQLTTIEDLLGFEHSGARVGKFAASTAFRYLKAGRLDLEQQTTRQTLVEQVAAGTTRAVAAQRIVEKYRPDLALFMGNRYTGQGELMDVCLERGVDVITWFDAHRSNALMLKRYAMENRDHHHASLSDESWRLLCGLEWTEARRSQLRSELFDNYAAGDWYSRGGTQFDKEIVDATEIRQRLRLDPHKKTAVIFPHIVWDATLFWGTDLFSNYEEWFVETVRAACANPDVNWIIKIHPAHIAKSAMERYKGEPAELVAVHERVGPLPSHVSVIGASTDINTFSLFSVMDYCLTVRGTIGIEAASLGIRVLTAGTGRYDHKGFTTDSDTREEYLSRVANIQTLPELSSTEQQLAERFAYGAFVLRPLPLTTLSIEHERDIEATTRIRLNAKSALDLASAPDLKAFAEWVGDGRKEDFLWSVSRLGTDKGEPALELAEPVI